LTASGPEESGIGDPAWTSLAGWSDEARRQGALVIVPHFPEPLAEVMADVILGRVDAIEVRDFAWGVEGHAVREWYRLLDCGYRIPAVGGTDKMSAGMPLGGVRTYSKLGPELTFAGWQDSIRAGRTITTSGPILRLAVDGHPIGDEVPLGTAGGTLEVEASTISAQPVEALEVVHNGRVVARADAAPGARQLRVRERLAVTPGWIAARCWGPGTLWHEWPVRVVAHTSPVYLGAPRIAPSPSDASYLANVLDGGLAWLDTLATRADPALHERIRAVFLDARRLLGQPSPASTSGPAGRGGASPG
jgi:hypothetical protein